MPHTPVKKLEILLFRNAIMKIIEQQDITHMIKPKHTG